jgi:hypothetical protein
MNIDTIEVVVVENQLLKLEKACISLALSSKTSSFPATQFSLCFFFYRLYDRTEPIRTSPLFILSP